MVSWQRRGQGSRRGNLYPTKQRPEQKIDAAVALMMAIGRAMIEDEDAKGLKVSLPIRSSANSDRRRRRLLNTGGRHRLRVRCSFGMRPTWWCDRTRRNIKPDKERSRRAGTSPRRIPARRKSSRGSSSGGDNPVWSTSRHLGKGKPCVARRGRQHGRGDAPDATEITHGSACRPPRRPARVSDCRGPAR